MEKNVTVYDVARAAGVSRGTVDRVVYGRGRVSEHTAAKVREAIKQLEYKANPSASRLAMKKTRSIAYLIPSARNGEYWDLIDRGFQMGEEDLRQYNIGLHSFHYDIDNPSSFTQAAERMLACNPDGVITNRAPKKELISLMEHLRQKKIPLAFIDTKYDDVDYTLYCGVDAIKSGELGAFLLTLRQDVNGIAFVSVRRKDSANDASAARKMGAMNYLSKKCPGCKIYDIAIDGEYSCANDAALDSFVSENPDVRHFICPNSRLYLISKWLESHPDPGRVVVGYDDLDKNLKALKTGAADFLITRKVPMQPKLLLNAFAECILHGDKPVKKNLYVHMDILCRMNMDDYL